MPSVKAWSYQKGLKLCACMQYVIYVSHLRTCLWNGFKNCPEAPQHCLPHLTPDSTRPLISRDFKTWGQLHKLSPHVKTVSSELVWPTSSCQEVISLTFPIQIRPIDLFITDFKNVGPVLKTLRLVQTVYATGPWSASEKVQRVVRK